MILDIIELSYSNIRRFGLRIEKSTRELVVVVVDLTTVRFETALDSDCSQNFFGYEAAESALCFGNNNRLAEISYKAFEGAFVEGERVWATGADDLFQLRIALLTSAADFIEEALGFLDVVLGFNRAEFGGLHGFRHDE